MTLKLQRENMKNTCNYEIMTNIRHVYLTTDAQPVNISVYIPQTSLSLTQEFNDGEV